MKRYFAVALVILIVSLSGCSPTIDPKSEDCTCADPKHNENNNNT
jgi:protein involved in sex pheromone biosynthesis